MGQRRAQGLGRAGRAWARTRPAAVVGAVGAPLAVHQQRLGGVAEAHRVHGGAKRQQVGGLRGLHAMGEKVLVGCHINKAPGSVLADNE